MAVDVDYRQRNTVETHEFTVDGAEEIEGRIEFEHDIVDFRFEAKTGSDRLKCFVQLYEVDNFSQGQELFGGLGKLELPEDTTEREFMSFSNFGYVDEYAQERVREVWYKVWIDGYGGVRVVILT